MRNLVILLASFAPFLGVMIFADPIQGAFVRNAGSLSSTFIAGLLGFVLLKKYGEKNGIGASIAWLVILALGLWIATMFK